MTAKWPRLHWSFEVKIDMPIHDKAFWFILFFLCGVGLGTSFSVSIQNIVLLAAIALFIGAIFYIFNRKFLSIITIMILIGGGYSFLYQIHQNSFSFPFGYVVSIKGFVKDIEYSASRQIAIIGLSEPYQGSIYTNLPRYPELQYGDVISLSGNIVRPEGGFAGYLKKEGVQGVGTKMQFDFLGENNGGNVKKTLLTFKQKSRDIIFSIFPLDHAAFMHGILFGDTATMSEKFKSALKNTGTTHLVALSGYNITIIASNLIFITSFFFKRKWRFFIAVLAIVLFVVMTGADASIVRAAVMGSLLLFSNIIDRLYSIRNALVLSAVVMTVFNPYILLYDVGFQLSFFAVIGITYLTPMLRNLLRLKDEPGFMYWRENFLNTVAAQIAVFPILLFRFDFVSLTSILTNMLVLPVIPVTMLFGFLTLSTFLVSPYLAEVVGLMGQLFSWYVIQIIHMISKFSLGISSYQLGIGVMVVILIIGLRYKTYFSLS